MSVPRSTPNTAIKVSSHSSSPTRSSLRRTSGGTQNPAVRSLLPSPHFDEPVISASHDSPRQEGAEVVASQLEGLGQVEDAEQQQPARRLRPFFTLIEDSVTHEHFHPTVHYIFADDDAEIITEAALRALDQNQPPDEPSESGALPKESSGDGSGNQHLSSPRPDVKDHFIVLDVEQTVRPSHISVNISGSDHGSGGSTSSTITGYEVTNAYSMSSDWQVLRTSISQAPTIGDNTGDEGLMLRIDGRGGTPAGEQASTSKEDETVEEMIERFERGLEEIRLVIDAGGGEKDVREEAPDTSR